jgi:hypothetical protein
MFLCRANSKEKTRQLAGFSECVLFRLFIMPLRRLRDLSTWEANGRLFIQLLDLIYFFRRHVVVLACLEKIVWLS